MPILFAAAKLQKKAELYLFLNKKYSFIQENSRNFALRKRFKTN